MSHPGRRPDIYIYIYIRTPRWVTHFISGVLLHLIDVFCIICLVQNTLWNAHVSSCFPCVHRCMFLLCSPKPRKTLAFWTLVEDHTHTQSPPNLLAHTLPGPIHGFHQLEVSVGGSRCMRPSTDATLAAAFCYHRFGHFVRSLQVLCFIWIYFIQTLFWAL